MHVSPKRLEPMALPGLWEERTVSRLTSRTDFERTHSPCFKQRLSLTSLPSLLIANFIQLSRYLLIFLTTTLWLCFLRKSEVFSTSRNPPWAWQVHRGAWAQRVATAGRKGPPEELEMLRHNPDLMWRNFPFSVDSHCWLWLVPLHELIVTFWFMERHCCLRTWTIWKPSGRWKTYEVPCRATKQRNHLPTSQPN